MQHVYSILLTLLSILVLSADSFCQLFGPRWACSGSKPFDAIGVSERIFRNIDLKKKSAGDKKA